MLAMRTDTILQFSFKKNVHGLKRFSVFANNISGRHTVRTVVLDWLTLLQIFDVICVSATDLFIV